jgi:hypothetical protein
MIWRFPVRNIKNVIGVTTLIILAGCSSQNQWSKTDNSKFTNLELNTALEECNYKDAMRDSNKLVLESTNKIREPIALSNDKDKESVKQIHLENEKQLRSQDEKQEMAENKAKSQSLQMASEAYNCMQSKNFNRV